MAFNRRKFEKISTTEGLEKFILDMGVDKFPWGELRNAHPRTMITEDFIRKYKDYIDWDDIWYGECTEQFIREFEDKVNWRQVSYLADRFSLDFIRTYKDKLDWNSLSLAGMDDSFYEEFIDYVNWKYFDSPNVSEDFIRKYKDKIDWNPVHLCIGKLLSNKSSKFLWEMRDYILDWNQVLRNNEYYVEFAMEHKDIILANMNSRFADYIPLPDNATDEFIETFSECINWYTVFSQKDFDPKFALKHLEKLPIIARNLNEYHMKQFIKMIDELPDNEYTNKIKKVLDMKVNYDYLIENDMFEDTYDYDEDDELDVEDAFVETYGDEKKHTVRYLMLDSYKQDPPIDTSFAVTIFDNIYSFEA